MMRDAPHGADLLAEARRVLSDSVLPHLQSGVRYQVLLVIRALDLAEREFTSDDHIENKLSHRLGQFVAADQTAADTSELLSKQIREGCFDASENLHQCLCQVTAFKLKETNPKKISDDLNDSLDRLAVESG